MLCLCLCSSYSEAMTERTHLEVCASSFQHVSCPGHCEETKRGYMTNYLRWKVTQDTVVRAILLAGKILSSKHRKRKRGRTCGHGSRWLRMNCSMLSLVWLEFLRVSNVSLRVWSCSASLFLRQTTSSLKVCSYTHTRKMYQIYRHTHTSLFSSV